MSKELGFIALYRKFENNFLWTEKRVFSKAEAWIDLLLEVNHKKETDVIINGTVFKCYRGQSLRSLKTWGERWNWDKSKVKRFFKLLKNQSMIEIKDERKTTRLTICNYDHYQDWRHTGDTLATRSRHTGDTLTTPNNNDNNDNNEKNNINEKPKKSFSSDLIEFTDNLLSYFPNEIIEKIKNRNSLYDTIDKLIRLDGETKENILYVVKWARQNDFWKIHFLSLSKLRKKNSDNIPYMEFFKQKIKAEKELQKQRQKTNGYYSGASGAYLTAKERNDQRLNKLGEEIQSEIQQNIINDALGIKEPKEDQPF
jgi:hypothetical protein